jgi:hypothetical protein
LRIQWTWIIPKQKRTRLGALCVRCVVIISDTIA